MALMIAKVLTHLSLLMISSGGFLVGFLVVVQILMPSIESLIDLRRLMTDLVWVPNSMEGNRSEILDGLDDSFNSLSDGMDGKLKKAARYFEYDSDEIAQDDYTFRPDMTFHTGMTYEPKDLDLRKPGVRKPFKRPEFEVTTEEVLRKADFRNVRFLANFLTDAGIIIKRSKTKISAKAQRKVAREIKTARAFGLMPFTTMGTKSFVFGKTMEALGEDFEYGVMKAARWLMQKEVQTLLEARSFLLVCYGSSFPL
ncbi:hypothetical protein L1049_014387 [Liquidambar formosana]|uniref:Small ribosomal subunit protein bS18c n=1 Tax=Liquidambar formosana TaxID=63359 RepID=A0AAP0WUX5_LIQFO